VVQGHNDHQGEHHGLPFVQGNQRSGASVLSQQLEQRRQQSQAPPSPPPPSAPPAEPQPELELLTQAPISPGRPPPARAPALNDTVRKLIDRIAASLAPTPDDDRLVAAAPAVTIRATLRRFWPLAKRYRKVFFAGIVLAALLPAVEAAQIWLFKHLVDDVLVAETLSALPVLVAAMVGLALVGAALSFGDEYAATWIGERFTLDLREKLLAHLQRLEPDVLDRRRHGDVLSRITSDVHAIETLLLSAAGELIQAGARILFFGGALFLLSWKLALASLVVVPLFFFVARRFARLSRRAARERRRRSGSLTAVAEEALGNAALVQAANTQERELARFRRESEGKIAAELAGTRISGLFAPAIDLLELAGVVIVIILGTLALAAGDLTLGGLLAFLAYLGQMYRPVRDVSNLGQTVFEATAGAERVIELLDVQPRVTDKPGARELTDVYGRLELEDVTYTYPGAAGPAVENLNLVLEPGHSLALVGQSGSGKTTAAKLALRFADPDRGAVRLDGHDLRDVTLRSVRANIALLLQDAPLFDGSVRDNVAYGAPEATDEQVRAALGAVGYDVDLDTPVGQRGRALSGGQRRRVAMARTLLQDAPVVVLDEPSAGLDADATRALTAPLKRLMADRATLLITHDPILIEAADEVVELWTSPATA
jgi:subfamily B ATP-binding cassette protein MsbA